MSTNIVQSDENTIKITQFAGVVIEQNEQESFQNQEQSQESSQESQDNYLQNSHNQDYGIRDADYKPMTSRNIPTLFQKIIDGILEELHSKEFKNVNSESQNLQVSYSVFESVTDNDSSDDSDNDSKQQNNDESESESSGESSSPVNDDPS